MSLPQPDVPLSYLQGYGARAYPVVELTWGVTLLSVAVIVVMTLLVVAGVIRRRNAATQPLGAPVVRGGAGLRWITLGLAITVPLLLASFAWTAVVLARTAEPPAAAGEPLRVEIIGHQWWWEVRYLFPQPAEVFATANELHVPVGRPVAIEVHSGDVIHSFWVPALGGKTDLIPGRTNRTWIEVDQPGRYRGRCAEYCGLQHAHMELAVVAEPAGDFDRWRAAQARAADAPREDDARQGLEVFQRHCAVCHTVRGAESGGVLGPDLTHLMSRRTVAAGLLPNTPGHLLGWIGNPQALKPGAAMPMIAIDSGELQALSAYLATLR